VDDFAVKYMGKQHAEHLRHALLRTYVMMFFRSSNVGSPVTFGREECGNPAMSSSGVDAVMFWLIRRATVAPCYDEY
jgi:hypothetical protein